MFLRIALILLALSTTDRALAADDTPLGTSKHPFGLGLMVGYPTAVSAKYYLRPMHSIDVALATASWNFGERGGVYAHASYLIQPSLLFSDDNVEIPWHIGAGAVVWSTYWGWRDRWWLGRAALGARIPAGVDVNLRKVRVQFFADLAMNVYFIPGTFVDLGATLGARYYF